MQGKDPLTPLAQVRLILPLLLLLLASPCQLQPPAARPGTNPSPALFSLPQRMAAYGDMPRSPPLEGLDSHSDKFQLDAWNKARSSAGKGIGKLLSFGRSPKPAQSPGTPEHLQLSTDDLLLFSEDSLPTSLLKHNPDNQSRAVKMFASILHYMGVHGDQLGAVASLELAQKLLHQGLKRSELRDELYMQLVKQTRGCPVASAREKAWQLFYLTAATMPPTKDFMGMVSGEILIMSSCISSSSNY
jgi:hypothetical protein